MGESYAPLTALYVIAAVLTLSATIVSFRLVWWDGARRDSARRNAFIFATTTLFVGNVIYIPAYANVDLGNFVSSGLGIVYALLSTASDCAFSFALLRTCQKLMPKGMQQYALASFIILWPLTIIVAIVNLAALLWYDGNLIYVTRLAETQPDALVIAPSMIQSIVVSCGLTYRATQAAVYIVVALAMLILYRRNRSDKIAFIFLQATLAIVYMMCVVISIVDGVGEGEDPTIFKGKEGRVINAVAAWFYGIWNPIAMHVLAMAVRRSFDLRPRTQRTSPQQKSQASKLLVEAYTKPNECKHDTSTDVDEYQAFQTESAPEDYAMAAKRPVSSYVPEMPTPIPATELAGERPAAELDTPKAVHEADSADAKPLRSELDGREREKLLSPLESHPAWHDDELPPHERRRSYTRQGDLHFGAESKRG